MVGNPIAVDVASACLRKFRRVFMGGVLAGFFLAQWVQVNSIIPVQVETVW